MGFRSGIIKQKQVSKGDGSVQTQVLTTDNDISQNLMNKIKINYIITIQVNMILKKNINLEI